MSYLWVTYDQLSIVFYSICLVQQYRMSIHIYHKPGHAVTSKLISKVLISTVQTVSTQMAATVCWHIFVCMLAYISQRETRHIECYLFYLLCKLTGSKLCILIYKIRSCDILSLGQLDRIRKNVNLLLARILINASMIQTGQIEQKFGNNPISYLNILLTPKHQHV